jgi:SAM-dependent methyltransferase
MTTWEHFRDTNRAMWDERVAIHVDSDFYGVEQFLAGQSKLRFFEADDLPPLAGRSLLHLQCHFGLDTLSLARLGARVTGLDFSQPALDAAADLARRAGIEGARWVCSDVYAAREALGGERFDVVYTGGGAIIWLDDIERWARVVADSVAPGGTFYMWEFHPAAAVFDDERDDDLMVARYPYFAERARPLHFDEPGTYASERVDTHHNESFEWPHSLGSVVTALIAAGLRLEFLHEFAVSAFKRFPSMVLDETRSQPGRPYYVLPDRPERVPMMYSLRAVKPRD